MPEITKLGTREIVEDLMECDWEELLIRGVFFAESDGRIYRLTVSREYADAYFAGDLEIENVAPRVKFEECNTEEVCRLLNKRGD